MNAKESEIQDETSSWNPSLNVTFFFKKKHPLQFSIVSINNGLNVLQPIMSIIQPVTIHTMLNNNRAFFFKYVTCKQGLMI